MEEKGIEWFKNNDERTGLPIDLIVQNDALQKDVSDEQLHATNTATEKHFEKNALFESFPSASLIHQDDLYHKQLAYKNTTDDFFRFVENTKFGKTNLPQDMLSVGYYTEKLAKPLNEILQSVNQRKESVSRDIAKTLQETKDHTGEEAKASLVKVEDLKNELIMLDSMKDYYLELETKIRSRYLAAISSLTHSTNNREEGLLDSISKN